MVSEKIPSAAPSRLATLCIPLRLATGWGPYPKKLSLLAALMLILLRLSIGWQFYSEGTDKIQNGFDSSRFLSAARGPFAEHFHAVVWDRDGGLRLDDEATERRWQWYRNTAGSHFGFDDAQQKQADQVLKRTLNQYQFVLDNNVDELAEIDFGRQRLADLAARPERNDVASLIGQKETIEREWRQKLDPILSEVDNAWENLERDMNAVASDDQLRRHGHLELPPLRNQRIDTTVMDKFVPWFDCTIGVLLILGLFTPVAALAAAGFLFSVFLSQFPPATGPTSTYYQLIESMACLVIASTGAGRFAGLDSIIHAAFNRGGSHEQG
ncbi:DoxX family protein [Rosistilla oblonga]|uniref:DoxX family protein n=1 Tax=Rosistilla oblonga TaxID=2527990 RepID=UPI003A98616D